jgi:serine/threonine protein kinase
VRLVKHTKSGRMYALKMLSKALVLRTKQLDHILCEKQVLEEINFPFIVNMYTTFQGLDRCASPLCALVHDACMPASVCGQRHGTETLKPTR